MDLLIKRVENIINLCWESFSAKVGSELIHINKEASMQLHFAYLLKNAIDLTVYEVDEKVTIELETSIPVSDKVRICDIIIRIHKGYLIKELPIELKYYRTIASSGKLRGAQDLFRFGVYEDLELLESYENHNRLQGIQFSMTDNRNFVFPKSKNGKSWDYDISDGTIINNGINLTTPIGGKQKKLSLNKSYMFKWKQIKKFYFIKLKAN